MLRPVVAAEDTVHLFLATLDRRPGALNRFLERLRPRVVLWCAARMSLKLKQHMDPEDLAQDVLIRVNGSIGGFEGREFRAFRAWLFTLAGNAIRDAAKYVGAKKRQRPDPRSMTQTSPSQGAARSEDLQRMKDAIGRLRSDDQEVIRLRCFEELPHAEVAERMNRTETAVRILYCRALKNLRRVIDRVDGEERAPEAEPVR